MMAKLHFLSQAGRRLSSGSGVETKRSGVETKKEEAPVQIMTPERVVPIFSLSLIPSKIPSRIYSPGSSSPPPHSLDDLMVGYKPTIDEVKEYARSYLEEREQEPQFKPIVGEEANIIGQVLCIVAGLHYMIRGKSGSGKTALVDKVLGLIPSALVYKVGLVSELALFRDTENINRAKILYIPEIQKAYQKHNSPTVELLKDITEGKRSERRRLNTRGKVSLDIVTEGKMAVVTGASENKYMEHEDIELKRRLLHFYTDESQEQIENINKFYTQLRNPNRSIPRYSTQKYDLLSAHIQQALARQFTFDDPFFTCVEQIIPAVPKSPSYQQYYYALINASAKFHFRDRLIQGKKLYISLHDHFLAYSLYHSSLLETLRELNPGSGEQELIEKSSSPPDWNSWWQQGCLTMKEATAPGQNLYEEWKELHLQGGNSIFLSHPKTGEIKEAHHDQN